MHLGHAIVGGNETNTALQTIEHEKLRKRRDYELNSRIRRDFAIINNTHGHRHPVAADRTQEGNPLGAPHKTPRK